MMVDIQQSLRPLGSIIADYDHWTHHPQLFRMESQRPPSRDVEPFPPYMPFEEATRPSQTPMFRPDALTSPSLVPTSSAQQPTSPTSPIEPRGFRSRRKDPSCDNCRKRKVRCDAVDLSACSECRTRGLRCQFTRDVRRKTLSTGNPELERRYGQVVDELTQAKDTIRAVDESLNTVLRAIPQTMPDLGPANVDSTNFLFLSLSLADARIKLLKKDLSSRDLPEERTSTLGGAYAAARAVTPQFPTALHNEAATSSRILATDHPPPPVWQERFRALASIGFCLQLLRIACIFSIALDFDNAMECARGGIAIGPDNVANAACGRYLIPVLEHLHRVMATRGSNRRQVLDDERLMNELAVVLAIEDVEESGADEAEDQREAASSWRRVEGMLHELRQLHRAQSEARSRSVTSAEMAAPAGTPVRRGSAAERMSIASILGR